MIYTIIKKRGFTLVETLVYIGGMLLLLSVIMSALIYMSDWYRTVTIGPRVDQVGITLVDLITKDIHASNVVNLGQSTLDNNNGAISITGNINLADITRRFYISNNRLAYQVNGGSASYLSPSDMTVSKLYFQNITSSISSAVRFDIDITYTLKQATTTKTYSGFGILKQSYE